nr:hypothetical protein B0A51_14284 [Rachicladosporium sp. CCFEE 5018]
MWPTCAALSSVQTASVMLFLVSSTLIDIATHHTNIETPAHGAQGLSNTIVTDKTASAKSQNSDAATATGSLGATDMEDGAVQPAAGPSARDAAEQPVETAVFEKLAQEKQETVTVTTADQLGSELGESIAPAFSSIRRRGADEEIIYRHGYQKNYDRLLNRSRKRPENGHERSPTTSTSRARQLPWNVVSALSVVSAERSEKSESERMKLGQDGHLPHLYATAPNGQGQEALRSQASASGPRRSPLVVIVVPTRELAIQVFDETRRLCYRNLLRPVVAYGGLPLG